MTDDVNDAGGSVNTVAGLPKRGQSIQERLQHSETNYRQRIDAMRKSEREQRELLKKAKAGIRGVSASDPSFADLLQQTITAGGAINQIGNLKQAEYEKQQTRMSDIAFSGVNAAFSERNIRSDISAVKGSAVNFAGQLSSAKQMGSFALERKRIASTERLYDIKAEMESTATNKDWNRYQQLEEERIGTIGDIGMTEGAQAAQKKLGRDVTSKYFDLDKEMKQVSRQGGPGSDDLISSIKELQKAIEDNTDGTEEQNQKVDEAERRYEQSGRDREDAIEKRQKVGGMLGSAGSIGQMVADTMQYLAVDMRKMGARARTGFADISNKQFNDVVGGVTTGDFSALRRINTTYGQASEKSDSMYGWSQGAIGVGGAAGVLSEGGRVLAAGGTLSGGDVAESVVRGGAIAVKTTADIATGYKSALNAAEYAELTIKESDSYNYVTDTAVNEATSFLKGTAGATRGLGGGREGAYQGLTGGYARRNLASVGINKEQAIRLTGMGVSELGGEFAGMADLMEAGAAQQNGLVQNAEQFMGMKGQLSSVGGSGQDLQKIMEMAVAGGMDNSKNIGEMVKSTAQLSKDSAMYGVSTVGAAGEAVGRVGQRLNELGVPLNMRGAITQNAIGTVDNLNRDQGANIFNFMERARLRKIPGIAGDILAEESAARLTIRDIQSVKDAGDEGSDERIEAGLRLGLGKETVTDASLAALQKSAQREVIEKLGQGIGDQKGVNRVISQIQSGKKITDYDDRLMLSQMTGRMGYGSADAFAEAVRAGTVEKKDVNKADGGTGAFESMEVEAAKIMASLAEMGEGLLKGMDKDGKDALKGLSNLVKATNNDFEKNRIKWLKAAKKAADEFEIDNSKFSDSVVVFEGAVTKFAKATGHDMGGKADTSKEETAINKGTKKYEKDANAKNKRGRGAGRFTTHGQK